jgi:hypothetical protein
MDIGLAIRDKRRQNGQPSDRQAPGWLNASPDWITKPPIEPGWYWAIKLDATIPQIVELTSGGEFRIGTDETHPAADFSNWLGPLDIRVPLRE